MLPSGDKLPPLLDRDSEPPGEAAEEMWILKDSSIP